MVMNPRDRERELILESGGIVFGDLVKQQLPLLASKPCPRAGRAMGHASTLDNTVGFNDLVKQ